MKIDLFDSEIGDFVDKCVAHCRFEETGVRLYERAIKKYPQEFHSRLQEAMQRMDAHQELTPRIPENKRVA